MKGGGGEGEMAIKATAVSPGIASTSASTDSETPPPAPTSASSHHSTTEDTSLYPIAILIDELKHDDVQLRLNSMKRLQTIAEALGPNRTRDELVPFLNELLDDDDEVLLVLAEEMGQFVSVVGGTEYAHVLLNILENLAAVDETTVREKAVKSIYLVVGQMSTEHVEEYFVPLLSRLATKDWFTSRISACGLVGAGYDRCSRLLQSELRQTFLQLSRDETPMTRRAASTALETLVEKMDVEVVAAEILPLYLALAEDAQDSVRLQTAGNSIALAKLLSSELVQSQLIPVIFKCASDSSWRVRWSIANKFPEICEAVGKEIIDHSSSIPNCFQALLQDSEAEVRTAAAFKVSLVSRFFTEQVILTQIIPTFPPLASDNSDHVRAAFASVIMAMSPILGRENTIQYLLPRFLQLLRDEHSEVRLNIISNLADSNKIIGIDLLAQSLLPAIVELADDRQWRVRIAIIEYIPLLASQLGADFFNEKLSGLCMGWLGDNVYSIREAATKNLQRLTESFGEEWACATIIPRILEMRKHANYLYRMTSLNAVAVLSETVSMDKLENMMLSSVLHLTSDPVPNIRFNACKTLEKIIPHLKRMTVSDTVRPMLQELLLHDKDLDVKYFANRALQVCS